MAHLFLASQMSDDLQGKGGGVWMPKSTVKVPISSEKTIRDQPKKDGAVVTATRVPHVNEVQLTAATGGAEMSCYRCTVPFGLVVLGAGLGLLGSSAICWRLRGNRKKDKRRESQTALMASQGYCEV